VVTLVPGSPRKLGQRLRTWHLSTRLRVARLGRSGFPRSGAIAQLTPVPASVLDEVAVGTAMHEPSKITAPALTVDGKPRVLDVGAEYCPYCATEKWALVVALSRFGTFTGLGQTEPSPSDVYPNTAT
jgi:hypothetical protein